VRIIEDNLASEAITALLREHFDDMQAITPPGSVHVEDPNSVFMTRKI